MGGWASHHTAGWVLTREGKQDRKQRRRAADAADAADAASGPEAPGGCALCLCCFLVRILKETFPSSGNVQLLSS